MVNRIFIILIMVLFASPVYAAERLTDQTVLNEAPAADDIAYTVDVSDTTDDAAGTSKQLTWAMVGEFLKSLFYTKTETDALLADKQDKVTGTCPEGQSIRVINSDGTVTCETDDNSGGVTLATDLSGDETDEAPTVAAVNDRLDLKANSADLGTAASLDVGTDIGDVLQVVDDGNGNPSIPFGEVIDTTNFGNNLSNDTNHNTNQKLWDLFDEMSLGGTGSLTHVTSGYPADGACNWNTTDKKVYCRTGMTIYSSAAMTLAATLDETPPTASTFATDSTGLSYSFSTSETSTVDCTKLTATWTTAGTISDFTGTSSPCVSSTQVYSDDTGTIAGAEGFLTDTSSNLSVAFSGVSIDNSANTATAFTNLVTNGDFATDATGWELTDASISLTAVGGVGVLQSVGGSDYKDAKQTNTGTTIIGETLYYSIDMEPGTQNANVALWVGGVVVYGTADATSTPVTGSVQAVNEDIIKLTLRVVDDGDYATFDNIKVSLDPLP